MKRRYYFEVANDLANRSLAKMLGLTESKNGDWYLIDSNFNTRNLESARRIFRAKAINETTSSSISAVINPVGAKSKNKVGTLFGGTFKQNVDETEFAGEKVGQRPGDQVRGSEKAKSYKKKHPFAGKLVGGGAE